MVDKTSLGDGDLPWFVSKPNPSIYLSSDFLVLDFETTTLEKGSALNPENRLILAVWYTAWDNTWHAHVGGEHDQKELFNSIKRAKFIVAHNAKFELAWLQRMGYDTRTVLCYDTMLGEWVLGGNLRVPLNLEATSVRYGGDGKENLVSRLIKNGVDTLNIPVQWLEDYCAQDVQITLDVFLAQRHVLKNKKLLHILYSRCLLTPVLADMETQGVTLDEQAVKEEYEKVLAEYQETHRRLDELASRVRSVVQETSQDQLRDINGDRESSSSDVIASTINWRSGKQVAELVYDILGFEELKGRDGEPLRTGKGARSTSAATLAGLKATTAIQREFQNLYKQLAKLNARLTKTLNFFKGICEHYDSTFYGIFNQGTTATHRLSSSGRPIFLPESEDSDKLKKFGVQLQNLPREYKRLVRAKRDGWLICEGDGAQLEFRVAAEMGGDEVAADEINNEADIHSNTAKAFVDAGDPAFLKLDGKERRQQAKPQTFKPLYGGMGTNKYEQAYCEFFKQKYQGIARTQHGWTLTVLGSKELRTPYGLIFYWPDTKVTRSGYVTNTTSIYNYPVQGFATAEIIPIAVVHQWHRLKDWNVRMILTIHDSTVLEIAPDVDQEALRQVLAQTFTLDVYNFLKVCYDYTFKKVPLGCGIKIGRVWGEGKEYQAKVLPGTEEIVWKSK